MTKNNYSHIKSFKDFKEEKVRLFYQMRLSEKKLEIKKMELQEYLSPIRLASALMNELSRPLFGLLKSLVERFIYSRKKAGKKRKKSAGSSVDNTED